MMYLLFAAVLTLSLKLTASAGCCLKDNYQISGSGLQGQIYHVYPQLFFLKNYMMAFDLKSKRAVLNMTLKDAITGSQMVETIYLEEKKGKKIEYIVIDNKICVQTPQFGSEINNCLPPDTKFVANFSFGGQLNCSAVTFSNSRNSGSYNFLALTAMLISEECLPLAAATLFRSENTTEGIKSEIDGANVLLYYDVEVLKNTDILIPPKICSKAQSPEAAGISKHRLVLSQLMEGVESFDVFTILNRLAQLSSSESQKKA